MGLPVQLSTFVGRTAERGTVAELIGSARLVTLTGPGGCGKTRLALDVASQSATEADAVLFADLSPIDDQAAVGRVLAEATGARSPAVNDIAAAIAPTTLLIVDNCEHVVDASSSLIEALLRHHPTLTVMVTSREPLGIPGEVVYRVPSLDAADAVALFVDRAGRAQAGRPDPDKTVVGEICDRLDGMPLAIELAAARLRVLSASQIRDGLHDHFRLLTGGARTAVQRQQTLQASVDWSHDLLEEAERIVLRRLSVFAGGFTLDAAEAVTGWEPVEAHHVLDLVSQLVDKSLVIATGDDRFRLLETVRQYAVARLLDAGEADETRRRHYDFVLASAWRRRDDGEADADHRARVGADIDNVRRALQWAVEHPDPAPIVELTGRLYAYWVGGSNLAEGADWTADAVERTRDAPAEVRVPLLRRYSQLRGLSHDFALAWEAVMETVELARQMGDDRNLVLSLVQASSFARNLPMGDQPELLDEAIELARASGFDSGLAFALYMAAHVSWRDDGDVFAGTRMAEEALALARASGDTNVERLSVAVLACLRVTRGEVATAIEPLEEAAAPLRDVGESFIFGQVLMELALTRALMGDNAGADQVIAELEDLARSAGPPEEQLVWLARGAAALVRDDEIAIDELGRLPARLEPMSPYHRFSVVGALGILAARAGRADELIDDLREIATFDMHSGMVPAPTLPAGFAAFAGADDASAEAYLCKAVERMISTGTSPAWARVQCLLMLAALASRRGEHEDAARLFGSVHAQAAALGVSTETDSWRWCSDGQVEASRATLGDELFDQRWEQGAGLGWEDIVAYILRGRGTRRRPTVGWESLTPTELLVVELVAEGISNNEIAAKLFMSIGTVKSHLTHIYTKLGMRGRAELSGSYARRATSTTFD
jgi:predicted ATPase/DNA-binding CsgD family transcriptional regulator